MFQTANRTIISGFDPDVRGSLIYKDSAAALMFILKENFHKTDFVKESNLLTDDSGNRVYSGPETGEWWIKIEVRKIMFEMFFFSFLHVHYYIFYTDKAKKGYKQ